MTRLQVGQPAPDIALMNEQGETISLKSLWEKQPVVLDFLRHFG
jgi:peroxiredoxin